VINEVVSEIGIDIQKPANISFYSVGTDNRGLYSAKYNFIGTIDGEQAIQVKDQENIKKTIMIFTSKPSFPWRVSEKQAEIEIFVEI